MKRNILFITVLWLAMLAGLVGITSAASPSANLTGMILWHTQSDQAYLFWCDLDATIVDHNTTWDITSNQGTWIGVKQNLVAYDYYAYLDLSNTPIGTPLAQLPLTALTSTSLPQSGHYARLDAVHSTDILKAQVARYFDGRWYTNIRCLVTLSVLQAYQAQDLAIGDYVWVYYSTDPRPGYEGQTIPIVVDKVVYP